MDLCCILVTVPVPSTHPPTHLPRKDPSPLQELTFLEFFAGEGNVWKAVRADSKNAVGIDWNYFDNPDGQNPMDILSNAGLGLHT